ncbi:MAG: hypothetical protein IPG50_17005 [Myxococcales bacterium]|nr:hypothetical protein [Myxococcales bacterium]
MRTMLLQDWISVSSTVAWPVGSALFTLIQSEPHWAVTDELQDLAFLVEVAYATGSAPTLAFQTAPAPEHGLFLPMQTPLALPGLAGSSTIVRAFATATTGPPAGRYVRWAVTDTATWEACFRITMVGF